MRLSIKSVLLCLAVLTISASAQGQNKKKKKKKKNKHKMELTQEVDSVSYSIGVNIAKQLQSQGMKELNSAVFAQALDDVYNKSEMKISEADGQKILQDYFTNLKKKADEEAAKEGREFLEKNGKRPEVTTTQSGLQYEVLTEGAGDKPTAESTVRVHYHGMLLDGTVFDSSVDRGETISFPLNRVIAGWTEGVQLMTVGSKYKFYIPYDLAYGAAGSPPKIPGFAALIFEVELFEIEK